MQFASFNAETILSEFNQPLIETPSSKTNAHNPIISVTRLPIHESIVHRLDQFISKNQIPHIIFHGPSGSGKLTLVREFIAKIYANDRLKTKTHVMTVNCSHGKGIQFIREELKFFAKANAQSRSSNDIKIILLLNAHHLTVDAQSALRRCIELFSYNTRFFIVVENKNKLLNPILSRFCDVFVPEPAHPVTGIYSAANTQEFTDAYYSAANMQEFTDAYYSMNGTNAMPKPMGDRAANSMNLHQYVLSQQFAPFREEVLSEAKSEAKSETEFDSLNRDLSTKEKMEIVNRMYESGISCLDLMEYIRSAKDKKWSELDHSNAVMRFYQIKPQFRCEKLLMLYMVNFLYGKN